MQPVRLDFHLIDAYRRQLIAADDDISLIWFDQLNVFQQMEHASKFMRSYANALDALDEQDEPGSRQ